MSRRIVVAVILVAAVAWLVFWRGPQPEGSEGVGIVVDVVGSITDVETFTVRFDDGETVVLVPEDGLVFSSGQSIGHLRSHVASGQSIRVRYVTRDDALVATSIDDA